MRRGGFIALGLFAALASAGAAAARGPRLKLFLPAGVSSDKVDLQYFLYGRFGAHGGYASPETGLAFVDLPLSVDGVPASEIRMFAWAPGCQIETFDVRLGALDVEQTYACIPQSTVTLNGRIGDFESNATKPAEVRIDYLAYWACQFFGMMDCPVPQIPLGTARIDPDGRFEIELPDFASGAIEFPDFAGGATPSTGPSGFGVTLREIRTGNIIAFLDPALSALRSLGGGLKPASSYSGPTVLVGRKSN